MHTAALTAIGLFMSASIGAAQEAPPIFGQAPEDRSLVVPVGEETADNPVAATGNEVRGDAPDALRQEDASDSEAGDLEAKPVTEPKPGTRETAAPKDVAQEINAGAAQKQADNISIQAEADSEGANEETAGTVTSEPAVSQPSPTKAETTGSVQANTPNAQTQEPPPSTTEALPIPRVKIAEFSSTAQIEATQEPVTNQADRIEAASVKLAAKTAPVRPARSGNIEMVFGAAPASIYCRPLMVCIVRLENGEMVSDIFSLGDDVRWSAAARAFGPNSDTHLIEVKRDDDSEPSSLTFGTNKGRIYSVELIPSPDIHTPILSFIYPDTLEAERRAKIAADHARIAAEEAATAAAAEKAKREAAAARAAALKATGKPTSRGLKPAGALDHDYRMTGTAKFKPQTIYNDGRKTYVVLPRRYRGDIPIVTAGSGGGTLSGRFDPETRTITIDRVPDTFSLAVGRKKIKVARL